MSHGINGRVFGKAKGPSSELCLAKFNYETLSPSVAKFLRGQAERIRRQCATSIVQIGKALLEAKRHVSHGEFLRWVEGDVGLPARTAQAYMRVAGWASTKSATVAHLGPSTLYLLSASSTPPEFVDDIISRAEAGEYIAPSVIRIRLKALRKKEGVNFADEMLSWQGSAVFSDRPADQGMGEKAILELVGILVRRLPEDDVDRVREILTSEAVLSSPKLAKNLERAFAEIARIDSSPADFRGHHAAGKA